MRRKGKRYIALFLAVMMIVTADTSVYEVFGQDAQSESASENTDAAAGDAGETGATVPGPGNAEQPEGSQPAGSGAANGPEAGRPPQPDNAADAAGSTDGGALRSAPDDESQNTAPNGISAYSAPVENNAGMEAAAGPAARNFDIEAEVSLPDLTLYSGENFYYTLKYTVPPLETGNDFLTPLIKLDLPENVTTVLTPKGKDDVTGTDVKYTSVRDGANGKVLYIYLNTKLNVGKTSNIVIHLKTANFKMEDGTKIKLSPEFTATANGEPVTGSIPEAQKPVITVKTDDVWTVSKSVGDVQTKDTYYEVPYSIEVKNTNAAGNAGEDRNGRLDMEHFVLTDLLPTLASQSALYEGYPAGGGAQEVESVSMGTQALKEGVDYTVTKAADGSVGSISINRYNTATRQQAEESAYITEGSPVAAQYTVRLRYPRTPYVTPSNEKLKRWNLTNTADLSYRLLGENDASSQDTATIQLGEKAKAGEPQKLVVQKTARVGDRTFPIGGNNGAGQYGSAKFALYQEEDGNKTLANDITGTKTVGYEKETDRNGQVTFSDLGAGTYYLRETQFLNGFTLVGTDDNQRYIKLVLDSAGQVAVPDWNGYQGQVDGNTLQVINTTDKVGIVEFYKRGTNADNQDEALGGVTFKLVRKNPEPGKTNEYSAVSANDGLVRFDLIPEGAYYLKEVSVGTNSDYEAPAGYIPGSGGGNLEINVRGNEIVKPTFASGGIDGNGNPVFQNLSDKGRLKIRKVNEALNGDVKLGLAGAKFELYGPYEAGKTTITPGDAPVKYNGQTYQMVTGEGGYATSIPLKQGYYLLKEVEAPSGYSILHEVTQMEVVARSATPADLIPEIENERKIRFTIKKIGVLGSGLYEEPLAGAVFNIYDQETGGKLLGTLTTKLDLGASTSNELELQPGVYWWEEQTAPEGYAKHTGRHAFTVDKNNTDTWQLKISDTAVWGQIKLVKEDSYTHAKLEGVRFGIYTNQACTEKYMKGAEHVTMTTDKDGVALSPLLPDRGAGYYVKELPMDGSAAESLPGYQLSDTAYGPVRIVADQQVSVTGDGSAIPNDRRAEVQIIKKDSYTDQGLAGVTFELYASDGTSVIQTKKTGNDGTVVFGGLKPDTAYYYREREAPAGYAGDMKKKEIRTPDYKTTGKVTARVEVDNYRKGALQIYKYTDMDADSQKRPMAGVKFRVYWTEKDAVSQIDAAHLSGVTGATNADGYVQLGGLDPRKDYYLVEVLPAGEMDGYQPIVMGPYRLSEGNGQEGYQADAPVEIENKAVKGKFEIEKISSIRKEDGSVTHIRASFDIYRGSASNESQLAGLTKVGSVTADAASGLATSGWLEPGEYTLQETNVEGAYTKDTTLHHVTVEAKKTNRTALTGSQAIQNVPQGKIQINKKAVYNVTKSDGTTGETSEYPLSDMLFYVYRSTGAANQDTDLSKDPVDSVSGERPFSADGTWISKDLDAGTYWVKEVVPEQYQNQYRALPPFEVAVEAGKTTIAKNTGNAGKDGGSVLNPSRYGKFRLFKRDKMTGTLLNDARFEVYLASPEGQSYEGQGGPAGVKLLKVNVTNSTDAAGNIMVSGTSGAGQAVTVALEPGGQYYLRERKAPDGYEYESAWTGPVTVKAGEETWVDVDNYKPSYPEGIKQDSGNRPLPGAYIGVFDSQGDAERTRTWLAGQKVGTGEENRAGVISNINHAANRTTYGIRGVGISKTNGEFQFDRKLIPGNTYYIMELLPPAGYLWNQTIIAKKLIADASGNGAWEGGLAIQNDAASQIKVFKYTTLDGSSEEYGVEHVRFRVYKAAADPDGAYDDGSGNRYRKESGAVAAQGISDADGYYITLYLGAGTYIIEEDVSNLPDTVTAGDDYKIVTIGAGEEKDKTEATKTDAKFYNPSKWSKFLIKKVDWDITSKALAAKFKLQVQGNGGGWSDYRLAGGSGAYTIVTKTNGAYATSVFLPVGHYRLIETEAPTGYTGLASPIEFDLVSGKAAYIKHGDVAKNQNGTDADDVVVNSKKGILDIQKYGYYQEEGSSNLQDKEGLKGIRFQLYKTAQDGSESDITEANLVRNKDIAPNAANPDAAKIITTGNNGYVRTDGLDAGWYWLKETTGTAKYPELAAPVKLQIKRGQLTGLTGVHSIKNITNYGKIRIKKVDPANPDTGVAGALFGVYQDAACTQKYMLNGSHVTMRTDNTGSAASIAMPAGQYYVKEMTAPAGYKLDDKIQPALVVEKKTTDLYGTPFENSKNFRIRFVKQSLDGKTYLKGATFALYDTREKAQAGTTGNTGTALCHGDTDQNGYWTTRELTLAQPSATYYLKELKAPAGYALSSDIHEVTVTYQDITGTNPTLASLANTTVKDAPLGTLRIRKLGQWKGIADTDLRQVALSGVKFTLYKVAGENVSHAASAPVAGELTTDTDGVAQSSGLLAGWYEVVETAPAGFDTDTAVPHWVEIKDNERNDNLYNNPIVNKPDKGQFWLYKYDGGRGDNESELTGLAKAKFVLHRWDDAQAKYVYAAENEEMSTLTMDTGKYESGYWEPGDYRLIEKAPPESVEHTIGGTTYTIDFELDRTPIDFHISVGTTVKITAHNSPKGSIELTKTGDSFNNYEPINHAKFRLLDQDQNVIADTENSSGVNGVYRWDGVKPGDYYIQEMDSKAVTDAGYSISTELVKVTVQAGKKVTAIKKPEDLTVAVNMENASDKGRLRIRKRGESDKEELTGAKFEIYAKKDDGTWEETPVDTVTVADKKGTMSKLLPAAKSGTAYLVKEVTAPNGYTLDGTLSAYPLTKEVTLYPYHNPEAGTAADANTVTFYNKKTGSIAGFDAGVKKYIRENPSDIEANETEYGTETNAPQSLLLGDYNVDYKIGAYASGKNEIGAKTFTVTDNAITMYYLAADGAYQPVTGGRQLALPGKANAHQDYQMNTLTLLPATNTKEPEKVPGARIYVQYTQEQKNLNQWTQLGADVPSLASEIRVDLSDAREKVTGVKVEYQNVGKGFQTEGIVINTTFLNRGGWSGAGDHEVRKIVNQAALAWEDLRVDNAGNPDHNRVSVHSNEAASFIPTYKAQIPKVKITNEVTSRKATYYAGDTVDYRVTVTNEDVENQEENFRQAVVSVKMPAFTELDEQKDEEGFLIYKMSGGVRTPIPANLYRRSRVRATSALSPADPGGDNTDPDRKDLETAMYTFEFAEDPLTTLNEGDSIVIEFSGYITYDRTKEIGNLVSPAYLSSNALMPKSFENPKGLSFETSSEGQPVVDNIKDNQIINDQVVGKDLSYLNDTVDVPVSDSTAIAITKSISADGQSYGTKTTAKVNPEGAIYYEITLVNNSTDKIKQASIVDVLPFTGDWYIVPSSKSTNEFQRRKTNIPAGPGDAKVTYQNIEAGQGGDATFYYYGAGDWGERDATAETEHNGRIAMLYDNTKMGNWETLGWTKGKPGADSDATAVGAQIDFTGSGGLESGKAYTMKLEVKAPGYTADQIEEYNGKLMANSAAAAVVRTGVGSGPVSQDDRVEAPQVLATMALPTGSIGDYVWLDKNNNGIQDDDGDGSDAQKSGLQGIPVTLTKTTYTMSAEGFLHPQTEELHTVTDQDGKYLFKDLPCNYLKRGADDSMTDPNDPATIDPGKYVGGKYYVYKVKFDVPDSYGVTDLEKGGDREKDSDINAKGEADALTLSVRHEEGNERKLAGEQNLSIDAGLVIAYSLGDKVWIDLNANGLQDPGEEGVPDTPVFLYKVDGPQVRSEKSAVTEGADPYAHMLTDENGGYKFTNLPSGHYIVRFDISNVRKTGGYAYRYNFTKSGEFAYINNSDSDAKIQVDADSRILQTEVIDLSETGLNKGETVSDGDRMNRNDPRWDAGLTVYSAISGFCFDDQDYDNVQSIMIPLAGTTVELYELNADGAPGAAPVASAVTGSDGGYFFDHLVFTEASRDYQIKFIYPQGYKGVDYTADDFMKNSDVDVFGTDADGREDRAYGYISKVTVPQDAIMEHCDAGARKYATIGDYVWNDSNRNGLQDDGEHPIPDVRVALQERDNAGGEWRYRQETGTNPQGFYQFTGLESSDSIEKEYRVVFALAPLTQMTRTNEGTNLEIDSDASGTYINRIIPPLMGGSNTEGGFVTAGVKPGYGETDLTWDAGVIHDKVSVGDYVWYDDNYNGIQDDGEKGVPNAGVVLEFNPTGEIAVESKWLVCGRTVTDAYGSYVFTDLDPGYYRVKFKAPDGYRATRYNRGTGDNGGAVDSDAARGIGGGWYVSRYFYLDRDDMTWDAGIYKPQSRTERRTTTRFVDRTVRTAGSARTRRTARTGDTADPVIWILLGTAALAAAGGALCRRKRKSKKRINK